MYKVLDFIPYPPFLWEKPKRKNLKRKRPRLRTNPYRRFLIPIRPRKDRER